jgi:Protein of unknown function (DUF3035)
MHKPITVIAMVVAAAAATGGCSSMSKALGQGKNAPDEFRVVTRAPLTLPPDYSLRPPSPGDPRPQELAPDAEARTALFGQDVGQAASVGERALVGSAGAQTIDPSVRDQVDFEANGSVHRSQSFADRVLSFGGSAAEANAPLDPEAERARLEELEAIRRATGDERVIIQRNTPSGFKLPGT